MGKPKVQNNDQNNPKGQKTPKIDDTIPDHPFIKLENAVEIKVDGSRVDVKPTLRQDGIKRGKDIANWCGESVVTRYNETFANYFYTINADCCKGNPSSVYVYMKQGLNKDNSKFQKMDIYPFQLGKMVISGNDQRVVLCCHVPPVRQISIDTDDTNENKTIVKESLKPLSEKLTAEEWMDELCRNFSTYSLDVNQKEYSEYVHKYVSVQCNEEVTQIKCDKGESCGCFEEKEYVPECLYRFSFDGYEFAILPNDDKCGRIPFKDVDDLMAFSAKILKDKGLVTISEESDEENYAEAAGIEW